MTHIIRVSSILDHSSKDEQPHSITDESKRSTPAWLLPANLGRKPLVRCCKINAMICNIDAIFKYGRGALRERGVLDVLNIAHLC